MCLLIVLSRVHPEAPLIVAANRDERYARDATAMTILRSQAPRVLGGRDELAGGTWLAVNQWGLVAGLTNRPVAGGRDATKRSRGELPLALASHGSAPMAAHALAGEVDPGNYNPAWILVGDRDSLVFVDMSAEGTVPVAELGPGLHVLENAPLGQPSPKVRHVTALLAGVEDLERDALLTRLVAALADHTVPPPETGGTDAGGGPAPVRAACVHTEEYGTRWSCLVTVPLDRAAVPEVRFADGPPCTTPYVDAGDLWRADAL